MKTDNIYFQVKDKKIDTDLVKAIEALPEEGMLILPQDAEMGCVKQDGKIVIYPYDAEGHLVTLEHVVTENYVEHPGYSEFRIKGKEFSYEVLRENPFKFYKEAVRKG